MMIIEEIDDIKYGRFLCPLTFRSFKMKVDVNDVEYGYGKRKRRRQLT